MREIFNNLVLLMKRPAIWLNMLPDGVVHFWQILLGAKYISFNAAPLLELILPALASFLALKALCILPWITMITCLLFGIHTDRCILIFRQALFRSASVDNHQQSKYLTASRVQALFGFLNYQASGHRK
jgi:hypothetical protein